MLLTKQNPVAFSTITVIQEKCAALLHPQGIAMIVNVEEAEIEVHEAEGAEVHVAVETTDVIVIGIEIEIVIETEIVEETDSVLIDVVGSALIDDLIQEIEGNSVLSLSKAYFRRDEPRPLIPDPR